MNIPKAVQFVCVAAGMLHGFAAQSFSIVCPPYYLVHYEGSTNAGELKISANYTLWSPPGVKTLRGVIVHQHGCGVGDDRKARAAAGDLHWQALARKQGCALLVPSYEQSHKDPCWWWFDPRNGSDKAFIQALADLAAQSHHPELVTVPWALWGHSGGACWAGSMLLLHPERVAAVWLRSGGPLQLAQPIPAPAFAVPVMCNLGTQEGITVTMSDNALMWPKIREFFQEFRLQGGLIGVAVDPNSGHDCGNSRYLAIPWFDACLTARLPNEADGAQLKPMPTEGAWLAPLLGQKPQPASEFTGAARTAVWLPNERIAKAWSEFVKDGNVSDPTPPPPPQSVRVSSAGELTWEAEADLESGIAAFVIERDGKKLARVPEQPLGYFVGRPTFQQIVYGDEPTAPLPPMRYTDSTAKRGKQHTYAVRTVNTVGLESTPTPAVAMTSSIGDHHSDAFPYAIISKQWLKRPETTQPRVGIKLDTRLLDACVGRYAFAPGAACPTGAQMTILRERDHLVAQLWGSSETPPVAFDILPESETNFFLKIDGSPLTFIKNDKGEVTAVLNRSTYGGIPDHLGKKLSAPAK